MTKKVLILHAYSANNLGDGLLVEESVSLVRAAFGENCSITVCASYPETFNFDNVEFVRSKPGKFGYERAYLNVLRSVNSFDLAIAVGGGYLRAGTISEAAKTIIVHLPQLMAGAFARVPVFYLPQSIGPLRSISRPLFRCLLKRMTAIYLRDDKSVQEVSLPNVVRVPDLAILSARNRPTVGGVAAPIATPVLSVRPVDGRVPPLVSALAAELKVFDGYVQSDTGSNRDGPAMRSLQPDKILSREDLMDGAGVPERRVVVAVRLHAALMAIRAGHYVVHLAYERKGFGAFHDLGLESYVHNVNMFEPALCLEQVRLLLGSDEVRASYDFVVANAFLTSRNDYESLICSLRAAE